DHRRGVIGDALSMKRGLSQSPLAQMKFSLAGQKPFAEQSLGALQSFALHKISVVCDQYVSDVIWIIHQEHRLRAEFEIDQIAVLLSQIGQKFNRIATERDDTHAGENRLRTWGEN